MAELTPIQKKAAEFFATNHVRKMGSMQEIASKLGVPTSTLSEWKRDPAFIKYQQELFQAQNQSK